MPRVLHAANALLALSLLACDASLAPTRAVDAAPFMGLARDFVVNRDGGMFSLYGSPFDQSFRLAPGEYLPVEVSTSRGDVETIRLVPMICGEHLCNLLRIEMRPGASLLDFEKNIRAAGARLTEANPTLERPESGVIWPLDGNPSRVTYELARHPTVASVTRHEVYHGFYYPIIGDFHGGIPMADVTVRPRDGTLSVALGDTIFVRYAMGDFVAQSQWIQNFFNSP